MGHPPSDLNPLPRRQGSRTFRPYGHNRRALSPKPAFKPLIRKYFHPDECNAIYFQLLRRRSGEIDNPTALVGSPVVYAHDNLPAIGKIRDSDLGPKRQTGVGCGQIILVKRLTTGGLLAVVLGSIPGCHAVLLLACRTTASSKHDRKDQSDQGKTAHQERRKSHLAAWPLHGSNLGLETKTPVMSESRKRTRDSG